MIMLSDGQLDRNRLQITDINGKEFLQISHCYAPGKGYLEIFCGTSTNDLNTPAACPNLRLYGGDLYTIAEKARVELNIFKETQKTGPDIYNDSNFCLHYREYIRGNREGWSPYALIVYPYAIGLCYSNDNSMDECETLHISGGACPSFTVDVPVNPDHEDIKQTFRIRDISDCFVSSFSIDVMSKETIVVNKGRRQQTNVRSVWFPAVVINQSTKDSASNLCTITRFYPMSEIPDKNALKRILSRISKDGNFYW